MLLTSLGGYIAGKGWIPAGDVTALVGSLITLLGAAYVAWDGSRTAIISKAATLPEVDKITMNKGNENLAASASDATGPAGSIVMKG